jgi:hypothetical protein
MNMQHEQVNVTKMANGKNKFEIDVGDVSLAEAVAFIKELQATVNVVILEAVEAAIGETE